MVRKVNLNKAMVGLRIIGLIVPDHMKVSELNIMMVNHLLRSMKVVKHREGFNRIFSFRLE